MYHKQSIRAIAQLVEHLVYTCANVFQGNPSYNEIKRMVILIEKLMSYPEVYGNNSLTKQRKGFGSARTV